MPRVLPYREAIRKHREALDRAMAERRRCVDTFDLAGAVAADRKASRHRAALHRLQGRQRADA